MKIRYLIILFIIVSIPLCFAGEKNSLSSNPKTYKLSCLRIEHRVNVINSKLRRGYTLIQGKRLKLQLEYYKKLQQYYKCEKR